MRNQFRTRFLAETGFYNLGLGELPPKKTFSALISSQGLAMPNNLFHVENRQPCACFYNLFEKKKKKTKNLTDFMAEPCTESIMLTEEQLNLKKLV